MSEVVVTRKFPGGTPGQVLPLDERTRRAVAAGNARILPVGDGTEPESVQKPEVAVMHGTGNADDARHDYDETTAPGEKGPEGFAALSLVEDDLEGEDA